MPLNVPNIITIFRILLVPFTIWLMLTGSYSLALVTFVVAGISDGVDGYLARKYGLITELGSYLDPLADKALLVSIYFVLGWQGVIPAWLVILVATRDLLIIAALVLSLVLHHPMKIEPLFVSKANTTVQILFAGMVLALLAAGRTSGPLLTAGFAAVTILTVSSGAMYMRDWLRHMTAKGRE